MKTTVNGKEIKLFGCNEISKVFTDKVNEYLMNGFIFYVGEEGRGHQGEEFKVCLTNDNGKTVYVIFLDKCFNGRSLPNTMELFVKKYERTGRIFWLNEGEEICKKVFYEISSRRNNVYVENEEDSKAITKISDERFHAKCTNENQLKKLPVTANKVAFQILKKMKGYKSVPLKNIEYVVHEIGKGYAVKFVGQTYPLTLRCK